MTGAGAEAGVGAEIMDKGGAGAENKLIRLCNTAFLVSEAPLGCPETKQNVVCPPLHFCDRTYR